MKLDLRELQDGENIFEFEEVPEDLHIEMGDLPVVGKIKSRLVIYKIGDSITAKGETACLVRPECARCLEPVDLPIQVSYTFVFQKGSPDYQNAQDDETLIWINEVPNEIDLGNEVKDYILLDLPMIPTCEASVNGPCEHFHQSPSEILEVEKEERTDPRWDALRALKNQQDDS